MLREELEQVQQTTSTVSPPLPPPGADNDDDWETQEDPSARAVALAAAAKSVDTATQAFGNMRIVQPPPLPTQDGGAYERVLFDPSGGANAQPVSAATASAAAASALDGTRGPMDPVLVACLENPRERLTLLKFEDQIVRFIKNPRESQLMFPPLSSYHRLIIHRLAERCCLEHQTAEYNPYAGGGGYDGNSSRVVTLFKTTQSIVPSVLLIDLSSDRQQQTVTPASAPKIMMRKRGGPRPGANGGKNPGDAKNAQRSMQDREKAYAEARARIFGEDSTATSSSTTESPSSSSSTSTSSNSPANPKSNNSGESALSSSAKSYNSNNHQASGPDGSRGFGGRGRGGGASGRGNDRATNRQDRSSEFDRNADAKPRSAPAAQAESPAPQPFGSAAASNVGGGAPKVQSTQDWKESKVLWRNREQEMNDPDFTRNHNAYRPSRNNNNGNNDTNAFSGGGGGYNRYAPHAQQQQMGRYPAAPHMEFYNHQQQQPPLPGRGRFPPGNEYNRIDSTGMQRPPPPPDHFRSGGNGGGYPVNAPPPPPPPQAAGMGRGAGNYGYNSSPHSRQYNHQQHHSSPSPVRRNGGGGYNDDFPPLGK